MLRLPFSRGSYQRKIKVYPSDWIRLVSHISFLGLAIYSLMRGKQWQDLTCSEAIEIRPLKCSTSTRPRRNNQHEPHNEEFVVNELNNTIHSDILWYNLRSQGWQKSQNLKHDQPHFSMTYEGIREGILSWEELLTCLNVFSCDASEINPWMRN